MQPVKSKLEYSPLSHEESHSHPQPVAPKVQAAAQIVKTQEFEYNEVARPGTLYFYQLPEKYKNKEYSESDCKYNSDVII